MEFIPYGKTIIVNSPNFTDIEAIILDEYFDYENEYGEEIRSREDINIFWCKRRDGKPWKTVANEHTRFEGLELAIHKDYFEKVKEWDNTNNG